MSWKGVLVAFSVLLAVSSSSATISQASGNKLSISNETTSSSSAESKESKVIVRKPAAIKFANAYGEEEETVSFQEFQDKHQKILRRDNEKQEEMLRQEELERKLMRSNCFHVPEEFCELNNFTANLGGDKQKQGCPCVRPSFLKDSIVCCNVTSLEEAKRCTDLKNMTSPQIHIRNATINELNMNNPWWKRFDRISITDGNITRLVHSMPRNSNNLVCLNVSNNHLVSIDQRIFSTRTKLNVFDVSANNLTDLPNMNHLHLLTINMRDNKHIPCGSVDKLIPLSNFTERSRSKCTQTTTRPWMVSKDFVPISDIYIIRQLEDVCPKPCKCHASQWKYDNATDILQLFYTVSVDCYNKGLTELPENLPENTVFLNVSCNNITSLKGLNQYDTLGRLYADNNQISSLLDIEGTAFKDDFEILSLKNNKLKQIPMYLFSKGMDKNPLGKAVYFGGNKLNCDCNTATELRQWLVRHHQSVRDANMIQCDNIAQTNVTQLSEGKLCQSKHDALDYIFYLIALEVILLLSLILKVSYDYYIFKTQSYLPWPASKMPKLPCDWLCES